MLVGRSPRIMEELVNKVVENVGVYMFVSVVMVLWKGECERGKTVRWRVLGERCYLLTYANRVGVGQCL